MVVVYSERYCIISVITMLARNICSFVKCRIIVVFCFKLWIKKCHHFY